MNPATAALCWSLLMASSFIASAAAGNYAPPLMITALRFVCSVVIMTPVFLYLLRRQPEPGQLFRSFSQFRDYMLISALLVGFFAGLFMALQSTSARNTSAIYTLLPLMTACLTGFAGSGNSSRHWCGCVSGAAGAILLASGNDTGKLIWHSGDLLCLGACLLLALHLLAIQRLGPSESAFAVSYRMLLCASLWMVPMALALEPVAATRWQARSFWLLLVYLSLFTTLLTFLLQQSVIQQSSAHFLLGFVYLIPVWTSLYTLTTEPGNALNLSQICAGVLILAALLLIIHSPEAVNRYEPEQP